MSSIVSVVLLAAVLALSACGGDGAEPRGDGVQRSGSGGRSVVVAGAGGTASSGASDFGNTAGKPGSGGSVAMAGSGGAGADGECGAVTQMAENMLQPADIIIGIDTSGSMSEEVAEVQQNLNRFSEQIIASGVDVRVIVLSTPQGSAMAGGVTVDGPCIAPPLGSGQCPSDSNPPSYVHIDQMVASWDVLDVYINAYPSYREHLRENSLKTFVTISDDNADSETSPFAIIGGPRPTYHNAEDFIAAVAGLEPNSSMWSDWRYSGIYSFTLCDSAAFGAVGAVHEHLVKRTGGVAGDLCSQEFDPVFDALAQGVTAAVTLACDWDIPQSQAASFDPGKTNVQLTLDGAVEHPLKVADASTCGTLEGWHYDNETAPGKLVVCPATCTRIQAAAAAQVDLLFGCKTQTVD